MRERECRGKFVRFVSGSAAAFSASLAALAVLGPGCSSGGQGSDFGNWAPDSGPKGNGNGNGNGNGGGLGSGDGGGGGNAGLLDSGCATASAATSRAPVYMLIVLDGSGSMGESNKWTAVVPALDAIFDDLLAKNDGSFAVGFNVFGDQKDPTCQGSNPDTAMCYGPYPSTVDVGIAVVDQAHHDALRSRIDTSKYYASTPTYASLSGGYKELEAYVPSGSLPPGGKKVLVLMTDGVPDNGATEQNQCTTAAAAEFAKSAPQGPITTFAVGIGPFPSSDTSIDGYDPVFMGALAKAGGAAPAGCNPSEAQNVANVCHFQITPGNKTPQELTQTFVDAIDKIRGAVASCEYVLDKSGAGNVDPTQVNVVFTDNTGATHVFPQDPQNGWTYDDPKNPTKVILHGADCDEVKADPKGKISVVLGCLTVTK